MTYGWDISCEIVLRWMSHHLTDDKSTLVQVNAWCHQATSHYLSQCWPKSMPVFPKSRQHVCFVRRRIQMWDVGFVKIISIWCLSVQFGRRSMKSIREDCMLPCDATSLQCVKGMKLLSYKNGTFYFNKKERVKMNSLLADNYSRLCKKLKSHRLFIFSEQWDIQCIDSHRDCGIWRIVIRTDKVEMSQRVSRSDWW